MLTDEGRERWARAHAETVTKAELHTTAPDPPRDTHEEFIEACRDPESVEFTVVGRNGKRVTLIFRANDFEVGQVEFASQIDPEVEEIDLLGYMTPHLRATGCRYGKVGLAFTWEPQFPVRRRA